MNALRYQASYEHLEPHEEASQRELIETLEKISHTTASDSGHATRSVHAKGHGLLRGHVEVEPGLPEELRQGVFAEPRNYEAIVRFSTTPGDILDDHVSTPRGMAVKFIGVSGERLSGGESSSQDFLLVNGPAFAAPDAAHFVRSLKLLAATTDKAEGLKRAISAVFRGAEKVVEAVGGASGTLKGLGGHPLTNVLGETYFTQTPLLYGSYMAKLSIAPQSAQLRALNGARVDLSGRPNGLRDAVREFFTANDAAWDVRVQLCTDIDAMPVEDSSVVWPQDKSAFVKVATLRIPRQESWTDDAIAREDALSFSPWHGLAAHRPLGSINRVRRPVYETLSALRSSLNGCPLHEPARHGG